MITVKDYPYGTVIIVDLSVVHNNEPVFLKRKASEFVIMRCDNEAFVKLNSENDLAIPIRYVRSVKYPLGFDKLFITNGLLNGIAIILVGKPVGMSVEPSLVNAVTVSPQLSVVTPILSANVGEMLNLSLSTARSDEKIASNVVLFSVSYATYGASYSFKFESVNNPSVTLYSGEWMLLRGVDVYMSNTAQANRSVRVWVLRSVMS